MTSLVAALTRAEDTTRDNLSADLSHSLRSVTYVSRLVITREVINLISSVHNSVLGFHCVECMIQFLQLADVTWSNM